jgi:hypothetical protein
MKYKERVLFMYRNLSCVFSRIIQSQNLRDIQIWFECHVEVHLKRQSREMGSVRKDCSTALLHERAAPWSRSTDTCSTHGGNHWRCVSYSPSLCCVITLTFIFFTDAIQTVTLDDTEKNVYIFYVKTGFKKYFSSWDLGDISARLVGFYKKSKNSKQTHKY